VCCRQTGSYPETGFEDIGALTPVNAITLPRSRLLDSASWEVATGDVDSEEVLCSPVFEDHLLCSDAL